MNCSAKAVAPDRQLPEITICPQLILWQNNQALQQGRKQSPGWVPNKNRQQNRHQQQFQAGPHRIKLPLPTNCSTVSLSSMRLKGIYGNAVPTNHNKIRPRSIYHVLHPGLSYTRQSTASHCRYRTKFSGLKVNTKPSHNYFALPTVGSPASLLYIKPNIPIKPS